MATRRSEPEKAAARKPVLVLPRDGYKRCQKSNLDAPLECACFACHPEVWCAECLRELAAVQSGEMPPHETFLYDGGDPLAVGMLEERGKKVGDRDLCVRHNAEKYAETVRDTGRRLKELAQRSGFTKAVDCVPPDVKQRAAGEK